MAGRSIYCKDSGSMWPELPGGGPVGCDIESFAGSQKQLCCSTLFFLPDLTNFMPYFFPFFISCNHFATGCLNHPSAAAIIDFLFFFCPEGGCGAAHLLAALLG